jgi:hypothetical protein
MEGTMECPYLSGLYMKYCISEKHDYVPSVYELREYCKERQHRVCQYYLRADAATVTNAMQSVGEKRSGD